MMIAMEKDADEYTLESINTLVEYRKGRLTLDEAVVKFSFFTGIPAHTSRKHIMSLTR